ASRARPRRASGLPGRPAAGAIRSDVRPVIPDCIDFFLPSPRWGEGRKNPSQADHLDAREDLLRRNQLALARSRAYRAGPLPRLGTGNVTLPERPGATLSRPHRVDGATALAVVEHAIAVVLLAQRQAVLRQARVQVRHVLDRLAAEVGDGGQLLRLDPDMARSTGAAVAAARAAKAEPVLEPRFTHRFLPSRASGRQTSTNPRCRGGLGSLAGASGLYGVCILLAVRILTGRSRTTNTLVEESDGRESLRRHPRAQRGGLHRGNGAFPAAGAAARNPRRRWRKYRCNVRPCCGGGRRS